MITFNRYLAGNIVETTPTKANPRVIGGVRYKALKRKNLDRGVSAALTKGAA
jgi:hypothetical protein